MTRKKRKIAICLLSFLTLSSVFVGTFLPTNVASAQATVATAGVLEVENADATVKTHTADNGNSYTGVTVGNGGESAYSGEFDGVFTGDLEIEYKFSGNSDLSELGDSMGNFTFRITSEKNPDQWFDIFIHSRFSGNTLKKDYYALESVIYGDYSMATGKTIVEGLTYERYAWTGAEYSDSSVYNEPTAMAKSTQAPKFHTDNSADTEKLCFEINKSTGFLSISYYTGNDVTIKKKLVEFDNSLGYNILKEFDTSEGYRISFSSNMQARGNTYYVGKIGESDTTTTAVKSSDICFLSLNGYSLQEEMLLVDALEGAETSYVVNDRTLSTTKRNVVGLNSQATIYRYLNCHLYKETDNNNAFSFTSKTPVGSFDTSTLGDFSATAEGVVFSYSVGSYKTGTSFTDFSLSNGASAKYVNKTVYTVEEYDGILIRSDEAYSGNFNQVFMGGTTIEYKFPGRSNVSHRYAFRDGKGDGLGNFYFLFKSVANPDEWFELRIQPMVNSDGTLSASKTTMKLITPWSKTETKDRVSVSVKSSAGIFKKNFSYPGEMELIDSYGNDRYAVGPHFNSDLNSANGDFTERLYLDVDEAGVMSVYYDMRGKGIHESYFTFDNVGKYSWNPNSGYAQPLAKFNDTATTGDLYYQFDLSQGYTVSFGSDFDVNGEYYDGLGNLVDLSSEGFTTIDGGTDIVFVSVGGLNLNNDEYAYVEEKEMTFDGAEIAENANITVTKDNIGEPIIVKSNIYTNTDLTIEDANKTYWNYADVIDGKLKVKGDSLGVPFEFNVNVTYENVDELCYAVQYKVNNKYVKKEYPITQRTVELESATCDGKKFVGWYVKSLDGVYPEGYEYEILHGDVLTAIFAEFSLLDGASIRLEAPYGIRFFSKVNSKDYNTLKLYLGAENFSTGIVCLPTDVIVEKEFNHQNYQALSDFLDFSNLSVYGKAAEQVGQAYNADYSYYRAMCLNISETYIARAISARAYLKVRYADGTTSYLYSDYDEQKNSRSAFEVALACVESGETGTILEDYIGKTANLVLSDTTKQSWTFEEDISSVCVNGVWIKNSGSSVLVGDKEYVITYTYDSDNKTLTLSYSVIIVENS